MDTIAYHQQLAVLAHERGDHLSAAQHYRDAANCYPSQEQAEPCLKLAEDELAHEPAIPVILVERTVTQGKSCLAPPGATEDLRRTPVPVQPPGCRLADVPDRVDRTR